MKFNDDELKKNNSSELSEEELGNIAGGYSFDLLKMKHIMLRSSQSFDIVSNLLQNISGVMSSTISKIQ
jgi:hypothetical protein